MGESETIIPTGGNNIDYEPVDEQRPRILARDPVCGMDVDPEGTAPKTVHRGVTYHFCTLVCRHAFDADPTRYVG